MTNDPNLRDLALKYGRQLPQRIRSYLNGRGISDASIETFLLGWNGTRITIPIFGRNGQLAFLKLAKDPEDKSPSPKMLTPAGTSAELYGWERVLAKPDQIIICEGEFDRLVLEGRGFAAITSTGGAGLFRLEWAEALCEISNVFVCFDNDAAGRAGAGRVAQLIPHAQIVKLPDEVGHGGDVTDLFVRLNRSREAFSEILETAQRISLPEPKPKRAVRSSSKTGSEIRRLKSQVAIEDVIGRYIDLTVRGQNYSAKCPFHEDRHPSFVIYRHSQSFYCFGCQAHGDVLSFLIRAENVTFPETLDVLRQLAKRHE